MSDQTTWLENNDKHLMAVIAYIRLRLQSIAGPADQVADSGKERHWFGQSKKSTQATSKSRKKESTSREIDQALQKIEELEASDPPPALNLLSNSLGLSSFDRQVLIFCAALSLDTQMAALCARAHGDANKPYPTFALAFSLFDDPDWNALSPHAPLRYWKLLEINQPGAEPLTSAALTADERIVNYLKGLNYLDDRLTPLLDSITTGSIEEDLPPSQQQHVDSIRKYLQSQNGKGKAPAFELLGNDSESKILIAGHVAASLGLNLYNIHLKMFPDSVGDLETFIRLWQREALLLPLALYIDTEGANEDEKKRLRRFLQRTAGIVFLDQNDAKMETIGNRFTIEVNKPTSAEQKMLWQRALESDETQLPQQLAEQFSFNQSEIQRLANVLAEDDSENQPEMHKDLWQLCRVAARMGMDQLAARIDAKANWEQMVLPKEQAQLLRQITDQVAQRKRVYEDWGFRERMNRGLGINALFAGESGTGKTMAAEVIANALELDLFRIDLSAVVSKYIGETEKNLRKLFDAAEDSGAILFFDEADALFGKRSEVKDSHDRYANIEINYLLQRMESYRGLAILATNMKTALDKAFVRRLRFIVDFPFPVAEQRQEIWRKVFPQHTPLAEDLDFSHLAKFHLTGGNILSIALNAAFLAAQENSVITMPLLLSATRTEFKKLERPAKESNFQWETRVEIAI